MTTLEATKHFKMHRLEYHALRYSRSKYGLFCPIVFVIVKKFNIHYTNTYVNEKGFTFQNRDIWE